MQALVKRNVWRYGAILFAALLLSLLAPRVVHAASDDAVQSWSDALDEQLFNYYQSPADFSKTPPLSPAPAISGWSAEAQGIINAPAAAAPFPFAAGRLRARVQQAMVLEMARAIHAGKIDSAKSFRAELNLPRGVSASEGALLLQSLGDTKREDAARLLTREAITWETTRVRQLFDEATRSTAHPDKPLPGRLLERMGEALTLANLPAPLRREAGVTDSQSTTNDASLVAQLEELATRQIDLQNVSNSADYTSEVDQLWTQTAAPLASLRELTERDLPSLLSPKERERRERLLLKLVQLAPQEYARGVRDGQVSVPLEYREAVSFTQQAHQILAELTPLWLADKSANRSAGVDQLEAALSQADTQIDKHDDPEALTATMKQAANVLDGFGITLRRSGTTADIVDEVMLEARTLLDQSLAAAMSLRWDDAERLRVDAYTTYDPELEARLMPRDPQLAKDIERLLLDGIDEPGVKVLLDRHESGPPLEAAYARVHTALEKATVLLKSDISPAAAVMSASSIVLREGLEGLLVIVAILAGLRGPDNAQRRRLFWLGIVASVAATAVTWVLSQTLITSLHAYGEIIEVVTGALAIVVLLLITNWLFHQVYWKQWVTALKSHAGDGESRWQLVSVGFLVGYREGFETVLFLQSLIMDAGGKSVATGVAIGGVILFILGLGALRLGIKLPYYRILLATAGLIGLVLITFVGTTVRAAQTVGWLPVHRLTHGSWPAWMGNWLGLHNTWESIGIQVFTMLIVLGTWRVARWQAHRKALARRRVCAVATEDGLTPCGRPPEQCQQNEESLLPIELEPPAPVATELVQIRIPEPRVPMLAHADQPMASRTRPQEPQPVGAASHATEDHL